MRRPERKISESRSVNRNRRINPKHAFLAFSLHSALIVLIRVDPGFSKICGLIRVDPGLSKICGLIRVDPGFSKNLWLDSS